MSQPRPGRTKPSFRVRGCRIPPAQLASDRPGKVLRRILGSFLAAAPATILVVHHRSPKVVSVILSFHDGFTGEGYTQSTNSSTATFDAPVVFAAVGLVVVAARQKKGPEPAALRVGTPRSPRSIRSAKKP